MFDLLLQFVILFNLTSNSFFVFFCFAEKISRSKLIRPIFYRLNNLISKKKITFSKLVVCVPIGLLKLIFFFRN